MTFDGEAKGDLYGSCLKE